MPPGPTGQEVHDGNTPAITKAHEGGMPFAYTNTDSTNGQQQKYFAQMNPNPMATPGPNGQEVHTGNTPAITKAHEGQATPFAYTNTDATNGQQQKYFAQMPPGPNGQEVHNGNTPAITKAHDGAMPFAYTNAAQAGQQRMGQMHPSMYGQMNPMQQMMIQQQQMLMQQPYF